MGDFFHLPWFSRVWTLQEIALNLNVAVFYCGDQSIKWSTMRLAMSRMKKGIFDHYILLKDALYPYLELQDVQQWRSVWSLDPQISDHCLKFEPLDGPRPQISRILGSGRNNKCSDPKDKVFRLFGLCHFLNVPMPELDYRKSVEQIFFEVTRAIVYDEENLNILYETGGPSRNPRLPSWVPDWEHGWAYTCGAPLTRTEGFSAGGQKSPDSVTIDSDPQMLKVRGKIVDVISHSRKSIPVFQNLPFPAVVDSIPLAHTDVTADLSISWEAFREWVQCLRQQLSENPDTMEAFRSTVLQGAEVSFGPEPNNAKAAFERWFIPLVETHKVMEREEGQKKENMINRL